MAIVSSPLATLPASNAAVLTKSDVTVISPTRALYIGGTGNANVRMVGGQTVLFSSLPVGTILPIAIDQLLETSTTATLVVAMW